eukprot:3572788-Rhodomonas_salina.1
MIPASHPSQPDRSVWISMLRGLRVSTCKHAHGWRESLHPDPTVPPDHIHQLAVSLPPPGLRVVLWCDPSPTVGPCVAVEVAAGADAAAAQADAAAQVDVDVDAEVENQDDAPDVVVVAAAAAAAHLRHPAKRSTRFLRVASDFLRCAIPRHAHHAHAFAALLSDTAR